MAVKNLFVNMTYTRPGGAIRDFVKRVTSSIPYEEIKMDVIAGSSRGAFIGQVLSSIKIRMHIYRLKKKEKRNFLTISLDGRYLFADVSMVFHVPDNTNGFLERLMINYALKHSKFLISISDTTSAEILKRFGQLNIFTVKLGVDPRVKIPRTHHTGIVVSHIGGIAEGNSRRLPMLQIPEVLRLAFPGKKITFKHVGGRQNENEKAFLKKCLENDIVPEFSSNVGNEVIWNTYAESDLYIYMSKKEGYSITPMEALMMGTPCLISDISVHREIYGDKPGVKFAINDKVSPDDIKEAYAMGVSDSYREKAIERTWNDTMMELRGVFERIALDMENRRER
ncbi:MAG: glycosyltransferase [Candidatus Thermoplasmatota archaeon]|nr:glycosyltransferase [Candidatus Thermoplasmatota archaeon]